MHASLCGGHAMSAIRSVHSHSPHCHSPPSVRAQPQGVNVVGNYAYVAAYTSDSLTVVDISSPSSPTVVGSVSDSSAMALVRVTWPLSHLVCRLSLRCHGASSHRRVVPPPRACRRSCELVFGSAYGSDPPLPLYAQPQGVDVVGNYAYVAAKNSHSLAVVSLGAFVTPSPPPSSPPPPATLGAIASVTGDPHVHGAHGDSFDFKGEHNGVYVLLTTLNLQLAAMFMHSQFFTPCETEPPRTLRTPRRKAATRSTSPLTHVF